MKISNISSLMRRLWIREAVSYLAAFFIFTLILLNRSPNLLRPLSMNVRFGFALVVPLLSIILYLSFHLPGWQGKMFNLTATLSLFALALAGVWASGHTQSISISGLIPLYDAQAYYIDALRLLAGRNIMEFSAARPLFTGLLATLLATSGHNLMIALTILTAVNALACYLVTKEIQRTHGSLAAVFLLIFLFLYYRYRTIGTVMSENLGLPFGILGVALIWRGITNSNYRLVLYGLFINTIGLNARPGAFFILPVMLLWGSWCFKGPDKLFSWRFFLMGIGAIGAGFALNLVIMRLIGTPSSVPFSQFSYALYGLASGGNSWSYIFEVHPELVGLLEPEKTRTIYKLTFELIRNHPTYVLQGAVHNWSMLLSNSWYNVFSFAGGENYYVNILTRWGLYLLCFLGLIKWIQNISDPYTSFVTAATVGILISVPFVPPADSYGMRLYAASVIIFGLLPTMGLVFALENLKVTALYKPPAHATDSTIVIWYSALLTFLLLIGPLIVRGTSYMSRSTTTSCQPDMDSIVILFDPGSFVNVIREKDSALDWLPVFHQGIFKHHTHGLTDSYLVKWLETIQPATTLLTTLDYQSNKAALVILPTSILPKYGSTVELCGRWESDPSLQDYNIFISDQVKPISD
jgi:hypothetical protein